VIGSSEALVFTFKRNHLMFEVILRKRGRTRWEWRVCDSTGREIMRGWEASRPAARYKGERALFLLLLVPLPGRVPQLKTAVQPSSPHARTRLPPS
jgi:hypothetical protein